MGAHTKGPWTIAEGANSHVFDGRLCPASDENVTIAFVDLDTADARLIASAPELLEALRSLLSHDEQDAGCIPTDAHLDAQNDARAAIARATGEAS
jgi:hypothetical protein